MRLESQRGMLLGLIAQWILVRTFGYATSLLDKLSAGHSDYERPSKSEHLELLRGVCANLYRQIRAFGYPAYTDSPTAKWVNGRWP